MHKIDATLHERNANYGDFATQARISRELKKVMRNSRNWHLLSDNQAESLELICHKISRILNGNANYADSWHDIAGYALLVCKDLENVENKNGQSF